MTKTTIHPKKEFDSDHCAQVIQFEYEVLKNKDFEKVKVSECHKILYKQDVITKVLEGLIPLVSPN